MHKLCEFIDKELDELEEKVEREGSLSRAEIEDGKNLAKFKMALLTNDAMEREGGESEMYPYMGGYRSYEDGMRDSRRGRSGARRRDAMGRYSRENRGYSRADAREDMIEDLRDLMNEAPDETTKKHYQKFIRELENA
jgi:hypothetical protein